MRYFRYKNTNKNRNNALKEQYETLTKDEKRTFRKEKRWTRFGLIASLAIYCACSAVGVYLLKLIPIPNGWFLETLVILGKVIVGFIWFILVSGLLTYGLTVPIWKKVASFHIPLMRKEIFSKACAHLREYYKLQEPYIVTKCFDATNPHFKNHDVCIFVVGDELRITTDLIRGFLHGERDLGCYAFTRDEIALSKQQNGNQLTAELRAEDTVFLLGYRAKSFIEKNFAVKQED